MKQKISKVQNDSQKNEKTQKMKLERSPLASRISKKNSLSGCWRTLIWCSNQPKQCLDAYIFSTRFFFHEIRHKSRFSDRTEIFKVVPPHRDKRVDPLRFLVDLSLVATELP